MDEATDQITSADQDPEQIRAEIEDTRADMSQTINEIQERLSPDHLMGQVKETVRDATIGKVGRIMSQVGETIGDVMDPARDVMNRAGTTIKEAGTSVGYSVWRNPIPLALIGLGVGMLFMRSRRGNGYAYDSTQTTKPRLENRSTEALSNLGSKAKESATAVSSRFGDLLHDNPLAVGAVAVAAGTAVGLVLPSTRFESEYIGETSEKLVDKAEEVARGAIDKVQDAAKQMTRQPQNNP